MDLALEEIYPFIKRVGTGNYTKEIERRISNPPLQVCGALSGG